MAEYRSPYFTTSNSYILYQLIVTEQSTNVIANTSQVNIRMEAWRTNNYTTDYYGTAYIKVDGSTSWGAQSWSYGQKPISYYSDTVLWNATNTVTHNSDGKKTINVAGYFTLGNGTTSSYQSFDVPLTNLDRAAPTVTTTISNLGVSTFTITATSNVTADRWEYSLNNGADWTQFSTSSGTSQSVNISGRAPNTTYNVVTRARKSSNQVYGQSSVVQAKTIGSSLINSVNTVTANNPTVQIVFNTTVYVSSYRHTLNVKDGNTTVINFTNLALTSGNNTVTLTSAQRNTLLQRMSSRPSFTATYELITYDGGAQIGSPTTCNGTINTSGGSAPTFTNFTFKDTNATAVSVTGNDQLLIQNVSTLQVTASAATAKDYASISSYSVTAGNKTASSSTTTINVGTISTVGDVAITTSAIDSRGYSTSVTKQTTVLQYDGIHFTNYTGKRVNDVTNTINLSFNGNIKQIQVGGVEKNAVRECQYRYRKTSDSAWSSYVNILSQVSRSGSSFSFTNANLVNLDAEYSWYIEVYIKDYFTSDTFTVIIPQGIPLVAYRKGKVGINLHEPSYTFDVGGDIHSGNIVIKGNGSNGGVDSIVIGDDAYFGDCNHGGTVGVKPMSSSGDVSGFQFHKGDGTVICGIRGYNGQLERTGANYPDAHKIIDDADVAEENTAGKIVKRTSGGYVKASYFNGSSGVEKALFNGATSNIIFCNSDGYFRKLGVRDRVNTLYTGQLSSGSITFSYEHNVFVIRGDVQSGASTYYVHVPYNAIYTTGASYAFTNEANYVTFSMQRNDSTKQVTLTFTGRSSTGRILNVYAID